MLARFWAQKQRDKGNKKSNSAEVYKNMRGDMKDLGSMRFPGTLLDSTGNEKHCKNSDGETEVSKYTATELCECMKINLESADPCTKEAAHVLKECDTDEEVYWKTYFIVRTYSPDALMNQGLSEPWESLADGIEKVLSPASAVSSLFTMSFGPNKRYHNECALLSTTAQKRYVRDLLLGPEHDFNLTPIDFTDPSGRNQMSKEDFCAEILTYRGFGPLTAKKNISWCVIVRLAKVALPPVTELSCMTRSSSSH